MSEDTADGERGRLGNVAGSRTVVAPVRYSGANPVRWQAQSSKLLNGLLVVGRFDFDWFPPIKRR
jgi:hypothetical protein